MPDFSEETANAETYVMAAGNHGEDSDPDHEVGDLQELFRAAYSMLSLPQRKLLHEREEIQTILECGDACLRCSAVPGTSEYGTVGDGFDGLCPSCADKAEAARLRRRSEK